MTVEDFVKACLAVAALCLTLHFVSVLAVIAVVLVRVAT